jgi:hypothetical protein
MTQSEGCSVSAIASLVDQAQALLRSFEPELFAAPDAVRLVELFARGTKVMQAGQALAARRVAASNAHRAEGHLSSAHLVAAAAGTSLGRAADTIETGRRLADQPDVDAAFRAGELSLEQAVAVSDAVEADPGSAPTLLATAATESLRTVRDQARMIKARAEDDRIGRYERQRRAMRLHHWVDTDGMGCGLWRLPPDLDAAVMACITEETKSVYAAARREGRRERLDRCAAEAFVGVVTGRAASEPPAAGVIVLVDLPALMHGAAEDDEICLMPGYGDVPVSVPRRMLEKNAFLSGVLRDGINVLAYKNLGRRFGKPIRTSLAVEGILRDGELRCAYPGCDRRIITLDHIIGVAQGGPSTKENCQPLCFTHNLEKGLRDNHPRRAPP